MLDKRVNILFDQNLWEKLLALAKKQNASVGELVRNAGEKTYMREAELEERRKAIEEIERIRPHFKGKLNYKAMIDYGRKY